jgi:hypothetical protein
MLSAIQKEAVEERCYRIGAQAFVRKPFEPEMLLGTLQEMLEVRPKLKIEQVAREPGRCRFRSSSRGEEELRVGRRRLRLRDLQRGLARRASDSPKLLARCGYESGPRGTPQRPRARDRGGTGGTWLPSPDSCERTLAHQPGGVCQEPNARLWATRRAHAGDERDERPGFMPDAK